MWIEYFDWQKNVDIIQFTYFSGQNLCRANTHQIQAWQFKMEQQIFYVAIWYKLPVRDINSGRSVSCQKNSK